MESLWTLNTCIWLLKEDLYKTHFFADKCILESECINIEFSFSCMRFVSQFPTLSIVSMFSELLCLRRCNRTYEQGLDLPTTI